MRFRQDKREIKASRLIKVHPDCFIKASPKTCCVLVLHKTQLLIMNNFMGYWPLQPCCSLQQSLMVLTMDLWGMMPRKWFTCSLFSKSLSLSHSSHYKEASDVIRTIFRWLHLPRGGRLGWIWISFNFTKRRINRCFFNCSGGRDAVVGSIQLVTMHKTTAAACPLCVLSRFFGLELINSEVLLQQFIKSWTVCLLSGPVRLL